MKKIFKYIIVLLMMISISGCLGFIGPSERVEDMLNKYIKNDQSIMDELSSYLNKQDLNSEQKKKYMKIIKDEYSNIKYEIVKESTSESTSTVEVKINVKDLYGASKKAEEDLLLNPTKFYTDGVYDASKFIDYKLEVMENFKNRVDYTIYINLTKIDDVWKLDEMDSETLEKIHGIYAYDK